MSVVCRTLCILLFILFFFFLYIQNTVDSIASINLVILTIFLRYVKMKFGFGEFDVNLPFWTLIQKHIQLKMHTNHICDGVKEKKNEMRFSFWDNGVRREKKANQNRKYRNIFQYYLILESPSQANNNFFIYKIYYSVWYWFSLKLVYNYAQ